MSLGIKLLPRNILKCFAGYNLLWHLLAIALSAIAVMSGFDWLYFQSTRNPLLRSFLFPAVRIGGRMPILLPITLYAVGIIFKRREILKSACAEAQAVIIGLLIAASYKAFTGRVHPPRFLEPSTADISREFRFGFLRGGVFWGWPSSHTTIAFAMAVTLFVLYSENKIVRYLALAYAFYIGLGVSMTIHWFSDFLAGAIFGSVIGSVVGKSFRERNSGLEKICT